MILIDTDGLESMVAVLQAANESISEAVSIMSTVTTHDDWGCKERDYVNELIKSMQEVVQNLQSDNDGFYNVMRQILTEFVQTENSISSLFESVESVLKTIFGGATSTVISSSEFEISPLALEHTDSTIAELIQQWLSSATTGPVCTDQGWGNFAFESLLDGMSSALQDVLHPLPVAADLKGLLEGIPMVSLENLEL